MWKEKFAAHGVNCNRANRGKVFVSELLVVIFVDNAHRL